MGFTLSAAEKRTGPFLSDSAPTPLIRPPSGVKALVDYVIYMSCNWESLKKTFPTLMVAFGAMCRLGKRFELL